MKTTARQFGSGIALGAFVVFAVLSRHAVSQAPGASASPALVAAASLNRTIAAGESWTVTKTTALESLNIQEGATLAAPQGFSLTMTVDGVETPVKAGTYKGQIVLTPAKSISMAYEGMGARNNYDFRTAVYVNNGAYVPEQSIAAAALGGKVTNSSAEGVRVTSDGPLFAAFIVDGDSTYAIRNPVIRMTGNGTNDFFGYGASIRAGGRSKVTIDGARIDSTGAVRTAIWVGDNADVTVNNAEIEVHNGTLPANYGWSWTTGPTGNGVVMMEVPWMLGLRGNNRATLVVGHGTATFNNSHIKAQAWGAMSTDAVEEAVVNLNKCHIETVESGYGAYADGNSLIHSSGSTFDVATYGLILSGGSGVFTNGSVVNSRRIGVMAHGGSHGTLTIDMGSVFHTEEAVIQLKSSSPDVLIDNASLESKKDIILEMFPNDDPNKSGPGAGGPPGAAGPPGAGGPPPGGGPSAMGTKYSTTNGTDDEHTTIKNSKLTGDFVNALTKRSAMNVSLVNSTVTGSITTAIPIHAVGPHGEKLVMQDSPDLYYLIGEVNLTYAATKDAHGATVSLDGRSRWVVARTSYLTGLDVAPGASVTAPKGEKLTMTVEGVEKPIVPGSYKGEIVLATEAQ